MHLYLIRHGAAMDVAGRCVGHTDVTLAPDGADAIRRAADRLPGTPGRIISSDLARARASAALLARRWGRPVTADARLREMSFGEWDGARWDELERRDAERLAAWMADWVRVRTPGGESFEDVVARARRWLDETQCACAGETVAVVAHAGSIRALCCVALGLPPEWAFRLRVEPASVSAVSLT